MYQICCIIFNHFFKKQVPPFGPGEPRHDRLREGSVGIDLFGLIRLKPSVIVIVKTIIVCEVGIDLFGLIRLKPLAAGVSTLSLICRDWSVLIDTIETIVIGSALVLMWVVGIDLFGLIRLKPGNSAVVGVTNGLSGLICLDWYDWNTLNDISDAPEITGSGLICLDWYDWNSKDMYLYENFDIVGIDLFGLFGLIRLKHFLEPCLAVSDRNVGIDLSRLIRLKQ